MVRVTALSSPFLLGFDGVERALDKASKAAADGYPPYNIERIAAGDGAPEILRITLAVAGFSQDQIEVTQEENQLSIRGRQNDDKARDYMAEHGYDPSYGARPLKRLIQRELETALGRKLLSGEIHDSSRVTVNAGARGLEFSSQPLANAA